MRLTQWTDYSLRVLMYSAACQGREQAVTIREIAGAHDISYSHVSKVVMTLAALGYLETTRGRSGGLRLLRPATEIVIGEVVRHTEADFALVECFDCRLNTCRLDGRCRLKGVLQCATASFMEALDGVTLADLVRLEPMGSAAAKDSSARPSPGIP